MTVPWDDAAVLSYRSGPNAERELARQFIAEGSLLELVADLARSGRNLQGLFISLPDRRAPPFNYSGIEIARLLIELRGLRLDQQ